MNLAIITQAVLRTVYARVMQVLVQNRNWLAVIASKTFPSAMVQAREVSKASVNSFGCIQKNTFGLDLILNNVQKLFQDKMLQQPDALVIPAGCLVSFLAIFVLFSLYVSSLTPNPNKKGLPQHLQARKPHLRALWKDGREARTQDRTGTRHQRLQQQLLGVRAQADAGLRRLERSQHARQGEGGRQQLSYIS